MTAQPRTILADYARHGWHLVPIPYGKKGPVTAKWNTREMCITDPEVAEWLDGNVGIAHAYSGTAAIDLDDIAVCATWFADRGVDLAALLEAPESVRIESRPGRAKLLYTVSRPLPSFKLGPLELRCASGSGLTLQDVLPPSIHPDTGQPYTWRYGAPGGHWSKLPPLPASIAAIWTGLIKPRTEPPKHIPTKTLDANGAKLRELLAVWDPDVGYDEWIAIGMALHYETQGHATGLALWNEWSSRGKKYAGLGDLEAHWRSFRVDHENPRTLASLRKETSAAPDEFLDLDTEEGRASESTLPDILKGKGDKSVALEAMRSLRRTKFGTIEARISNVAAVLGEPDVCGFHLSLDAYLDAIVVAPHGTEDWRPLTDTDYTNLRCWLETAGNCEPIAHEMMRQAVHLVAEQQRTDSAQAWLSKLEWDGTPRVGRFCHTYFGTLDDDYTRATGLYLWTALAGRIMEPGCQADMVPVLIGRQGVGKSRGVQAIAPSMAQYAEVRIDEADDAIARKMRGVVVGEMAEMRGLRAAEVERVKAFVTRTHERWVPKYKEFATDYPRRFVIIGTTNDEEFLPIDTEHRRWLPLHTLKVDVQSIARDREQLWAEAAQIWAEDGIAWQGLDKLAAPARRMAAAMDAWEPLIASWLKEHRAPHVRMNDVLSEAIGLDLRVSTRAHELRAGRVLRALGYARKVIRDNGAVVRAWEFDPTS